MKASSPTSSSDKSDTSTISPDRLSTLTDGVFAIAMTFLVLDVKDAVVEAHQELLLPVLLPKLGSYVLGFIICTLSFARSPRPKHHKY